METRLKSSDFKDLVKTSELVTLAIESSKLDCFYFFDSSPSLNWLLNSLFFLLKKLLCNHHNDNKLPARTARTINQINISI